jgi:hypothetical protein
VPFLVLVIALWRLASRKSLPHLPSVPRRRFLLSCRKVTGGSGLEILECRRSFGEDFIGQIHVADSSRHSNGPNQRAEY